MRKSPLTIALAVASLLALGMAGTAFGTDVGGTGGVGTGHEHPVGASPFRGSLVPGFFRCVSDNAAHDPTLPGRSCNPPVPTSSLLAVGPSSLGFFRFMVLTSGCAPFDPTKCAPDGIIRLRITDVRSGIPTGPAYNGSVILSANFVNSSNVAEFTQFQVTDAKNKLDTPSGSCTAAYDCSATEVPVPFPVTATCTAGTCNAQTTFNTLCTPACITVGGRAVVEFGQFNVVDMGGNRFEDQGIFFP